jgi:hypothetical protein
MRTARPGMVSASRTQCVGVGLARCGIEVGVRGAAVLGCSAANLARNQSLVVADVSRLRLIARLDIRADSRRLLHFMVRMRVRHLRFRFAMSSAQLQLQRVKPANRATPAGLAAGPEAPATGRPGGLPYARAQNAAR